MRLRDLREARGLTQSEAAAIFDMPMTTYRNYERGDRQPPIEVLFQFADYYGVSLDYLLGHSVSPEEMQKTQLDSLYKLLNDEGKALLLLMARMIVKSGDYLSI